ncbi:MAG TPA: hypothetical protein VMB18_01135 [Terriglobales bacterium]|nr:hypothetical protein [Terriglobales bacterium]
MKPNKLQIITLCLVALIALLGASNVNADDRNKATKLTFSEPVEVPGAALGAGTYWFQLADTRANRNIVQIWNEDRSKLLATILAIPDYRKHTTDKPVVKFDERPTGTPEAIQAWFYPGDNLGQEFVYPKARATQIAQQAQKPVLEMPDEQAAAPAPVLQQAPVKAVQPTGEEVEVAEVVATEAALPATGSPLPLLGVLGVLALGAGLTLRLTASNAA